MTNKQLKEEVLIVINMYFKGGNWKEYLDKHKHKREVYKELQKVLDGGE